MSSFTQATARLLPILCALLLPTALAMILAPPPSNSVCPSRAAHQAASPARQDVLNNDALDPVRFEALLGNTEAGAELAARLLDRFESWGARDDLFEAVQWIDRDWDQEPFLRRDVVQRLVLKHCDGPVLRWNWICVAGE
jgi:hypothetical protein